MLCACRIQSFLVTLRCMLSCLSQWSRGLRSGSAAAHLLGLRVRIPTGVYMSVVIIACCQVEVSATS